MSASTSRTSNYVPGHNLVSESTRQESRPSDTLDYVPGHNSSQQKYLTCCLCKTLKPADEFGLEPRRPRGYRSACKPCEAQRNRQRRAAKVAESEEYRQRRNELNRRWREDNRQKVREYSREIMRRWREANPEKRRASDHRSYCRRKEKVYAYNKVWQERNVDYYIARWKAWNRSRKRNQKTDKAEYAFWLRRFASQKSCAACRRLRSHMEFDLDGRTRDGLSKQCIHCLPPLKNPKGGHVFLDATSENTRGVLTDLHQSIEDTCAVDPQEYALFGELTGWIQEHLTDQQQAFLAAYTENSLSMEAAAAEIGVDVEAATAILVSIQDRAQAHFDFSAEGGY